MTNPNVREKQRLGCLTVAQAASGFRLQAYAALGTRWSTWALRPAQHFLDTGKIMFPFFHLR